VYRRNRQGTAKGTAKGAAKGTAKGAAKGTAKGTAKETKASEYAESGSQVTGITPSNMSRNADFEPCPSSVEEEDTEAGHEEEWEGSEVTSRTQLPVRESKRSRTSRTMPQATTQDQRQPEEDREILEGELIINWGDEEDFKNRLPI
jgi:hypothetical protein